MRRIRIAFTTLTILIAAGSVARGQERLYVAELRGQRPILADQPSRLSPALLALKDSRGILKGSDDDGRPILAVARPNFAAFSSSSAVRAVLNVAPRNWHPIRQLKISYAQNNKLTPADLRALGLRLVEDYVRGSFLVVEPIRHQIDAALAERLAGTAKVRFAAPVLQVKAIPPSNLVPTRPVPMAPITTAATPPTNDPLWPALWNMRNIRADVAWKHVHDSPNVIVAVIDTGVDYTHNDLKDNMWADPAGKHGYDFVDNDSDPMDLNDHGTHCAGTVGAVGNNRLGVVGVNWKVQIMAVRWLDAGGGGNVINAIKAIDFAVDHGAKVLSNSWYWPDDDPDLEAAIQRAQTAGALFVAAAGNFADPGNNDGDNDNASTTGRYPSAYPEANIIAVAAIDESDHKADFSEYGRTTVDLAAPGVLITSTIRNNRYDGSFSGTSMATPHVAGAAALTLAANPEADYPQIKHLLLDRARKIPAMEGKCVSGGTLDLSFLNPAGVAPAGARHSRP